jgi:hypothetical protein
MRTLKTNGSSSGVSEGWGLAAPVVSRTPSVKRSPGGGSGGCRREGWDDIKNEGWDG